MKRKDLIRETEKLTGGLSSGDRDTVESFFRRLEEKIDLPVVGTNQLMSHFIRAFEYYQDQGKETDEIVRILDPEHLSDFYEDNERVFYSMDNAAIIYPLGMRYGQMPMFRLAAELKEDVVPCLLQLALDLTVKRFPCFSVVTKKGFFWHYFESTNAIVQIEEEKDIPCRPMSLLLRSKGSFRVLYYKKRISVELFHAITDGTGGMIFLKTLTAEYLRLLGHEIPCTDGVLDIDERPDEREFENEFYKAEGKGDFSTFMDKSSLQLDGRLTGLNISRIIHLEMDANRLKDISKEYSCTVTAYILANMFMAARDAISRKEGMINMQVPVNMRKFNGSGTLRNYSMYFNTSMDISEIKDKKTVAGIMNEQILERGSQETMNQMMKTTGKLIDTLSYVPVFLKNPLIQLVYSFFSNKIICCTLSNLGVIKVPEVMRDLIDLFYFVFVPGRPNRATVSLLTYNDRAVLSIIKSNRESTFEDMIYEYLKEDGLEIEVKGSVNYES